MDLEMVTWKQVGGNREIYKNGQCRVRVQSRVRRLRTDNIWVNEIDIPIAAL